MTRRSARARPALVAATAALAALGGCSQASDAPVQRDLRLLEHMIRLNALHFGIEPHLRHVEQFPEIARVAGEIATLAEDPLFVGWPQQPGYPHPPELFEEYRADLLAGARATRAAAEAGDKEALHAAFTAMDVTCTACHKRFSPTY